MASTELIILSSSPGYTERSEFFRPKTTSPVPKRKSIIKTGSRAADIPQGIASGFCTARVFAQVNGLDLAEKPRSETPDVEEIDNNVVVCAVVEEVDGEPYKKEERSRQRKTTKRKDASKLRLDKMPAAKRSRTTNNRSEVELNADELFTEAGAASSHSLRHLAETSKPKKSRSKKSESGHQKKLERAQITKSLDRVERKVIETFDGMRTTDLVSSHFQSHSAKTPSPNVEDDKAETQTTTSKVESVIAPLVIAPLIIVPEQDTQARDSQKAVLADLQGRHGFNAQSKDNGVMHVSRDDKNDIAVDSPQIEELCPCPVSSGPQADFMSTKENLDNVTTKEIGSIAASSDSLPLIVSSKSSRTVTSIALAQYSGPISVSGPAGNHDGLSASKSKGASMFGTHIKALVSNELPKPKRKRTQKAKKAAIVIPKLPSPESALRKMKQQDFLFATSSQLAHEEPPEFIRDLNQALEASECEYHDIEALDTSMGGSMSYVESGGVKTGKQSTKLWAAGTRDHEQALLPADPKHTGKSTAHVPQSPNDFVDIDTFDVSPKQQTITDVEDSCAQVKEPCNVQSTSQACSDTPVRRLKITTSKSLKERSQLLCNAGSMSRSQSPNKSQQRAFTSGSMEEGDHLNVRSTINQEKQSLQSSLRNPVAMSADATVAKPKKSRQSKNKPITPPTTEILNKDSTVSKKPRGRPRKDAASTGTAGVPKRSRKAKTADQASSNQRLSTSKADTEEWPAIEDIEDEIGSPSSSPPRYGAKARPQQLELSTSDVNPKGSKKTKGFDVDVVFPQITKAVVSAPRTTDPESPSWYEKILLYDPIVLEDLTTWLNNGPLRDAGRSAEEKEVDEAVVQAWCRENSVCCLYREGLRGGVKLKY